jgi:hypothetical protein
MINILKQAYENEIELEKYIKAQYNFSKNLLNFKVLKCSELQGNMGFLFPLFYFSYSVYVFLRILISFFLLFLFCFLTLFKKLEIQKPSDVIYFPTNSNAETIIQNVFEQFNFEIKLTSKNKVSIFFLLKNLSVKDLIHVSISSIKFYINLLFYKSNRFLIYLNSIDSIFLILLIKYLKKNNQKVIVTDDQCQRWAFIISNISEKSIFVQHGYISESIKFPHNFGKVDTYFIRDICFKEVFSLYFTVNNFKILRRNIHFTNTGFPFSIFLASSSPYIDKEIEFLKLLRKHFTIPIIVKKHPVHTYNMDKLNNLYSLSDYICKSNENPECNIFVSFSSFMEYDYKSNLIQTISLSEFTNYNDLVKLIADIQ